MRRWLAVVVSVVALLGILAPAANAQAPKVTINGLIDNITSWNRNMSVQDANYDRTDEEWYARTRVRPDITAEVGTTKFVLGIEIDATWGQWGAQDTNACIGTACPSANPQHFGANGGWDVNTDTIGLFELKWAYTEFDVPWVPGGRLRLGAQPLGNIATYKLAALINGDAAGAYFTWSITPAIRAHVAYFQFEDQSKESRSIATFSQVIGGQTFNGIRNGSRGEDWAMVSSVEITPFKGLDIRPVYAYFEADGTTSGSSRGGKGGVANAAFSTTAVTFAPFTVGGVAFPGTGPVLLPGFLPQDIEARHTIGLDARLRLGPFSLDPTVMYQFGSRDLHCGAGVAGCSAAGKANQDIDAWLVDVRAGFQAGPALIEGAFIWSSGNRSKDNLGDNVNYYQPIDTDSSYYAGWSQISGLDLDYFNQLYYTAAGLSPGQTISYDKYGLLRLGLKGTYALTPAFSIRAGVTYNRTDREVDTNAVMTPGYGLIPIHQLNSAMPERKKSYLGTEINGGFTWLMAPNLAFDLVGAYMFAGDALGYLQQVSSTGAATVGNTSRDREDIKSVAARVRFTF